MRVSRGLGKPSKKNGEEVRCFELHGPYSVTLPLVTAFCWRTRAPLTVTIVVSHAQPLPVVYWLGVRRWCKHCRAPLPQLFCG